MPRLSLPSQSTAARHSIRHSTDTSQATPAVPTLLHHTLPDLHGAHNIAHLETVAVHAVSSSLLSRHSAVRQALVVFVCDHLSCKHHGSASHSAAPSLVAAPSLLYLPHPGMHGMSSASHHYAVAGHVPLSSQLSLSSADPHDHLSCICPCNGCHTAAPTPPAQGAEPLLLLSHAQLWPAPLPNRHRRQPPARSGLGCVTRLRLRAASLAWRLPLHALPFPSSHEFPQPLFELLLSEPLPRVELEERGRVLRVHSEGEGMVSVR